MPDATKPTAKWKEDQDLAAIAHDCQAKLYDEYHNQIKKPVKLRAGLQIGGGVLSIGGGLAATGIGLFADQSADAARVSTIVTAGTSAIGGILALIGTLADKKTTDQLVQRYESRYRLWNAGKAAKFQRNNPNEATAHFLKCAEGGDPSLTISEEGAQCPSGQKRGVGGRCEVACPPGEKNTNGSCASVCPPGATFINNGTYKGQEIKGLCFDNFEVTVGAYRTCVEQGRCSIPEKSTDQVEVYNYGRADRAAHPINFVSLEDAKAYCRFAGGRLPTNYEWAWAAGGNQGRQYPWGNSPRPDCSYAIMKDSSGHGCSKGTTSEVGSRDSGKSPDGLYDMVGNVHEWTDSYPQVICG
ncbi:MAG: SUMF1/EgtB/PvdO family nonheme iron enzyme, partial [Planctomycetales bacterium]|nr:SUMF1/EgtB/PvdO family nonheme iron enzyme [Planctomycetales bacterium]